MLLVRARMRASFSSTIIVDTMDLQFSFHPKLAGTRRLKPTGTAID
jgi:hypothetical protein